MVFDNTISDNDNRLYYLDVMRIAASFAVIILHMSGQYWSSVSIDSSEWTALNIYDGIVQWAVPVFVMISGSLFLKEYKPLRQIFGKYILRILTAFIFWSFLYAAILFISGNGIKVSLKTFFSGFYHLWFLFMIAALYMLIPFFRVIVADRKRTRYFLILSFIFAIIVPQIISVISVFHAGAASFMTEIMDKFRMHFVLGYSFYFVLGYYIDSDDISARLLRFIYIAGICSFPFTVIFTWLFSRISGSGQLLFYDAFTVNVVMQAIFIFVLVKRRLFGASLSKKTRSMISALSKFSFGSYLIHPAVMILLYVVFDLGPLSFHPAISIPVLGIIVFVLSFTLSGLINKIPFLNKYIV